MNEDELRAIEARVLAAWPGPWAVIPGTAIVVQYDPEYPDRIASAIATGSAHIDPAKGSTFGCDMYADAEFIAHAREDMTKLIAEIRHFHEG